MAEIIKFPRPFRSREVPPATWQEREQDWIEAAEAETAEPCWLAADPSDPECDCPECRAIRNDLEPIAPAQSEPPKDPTE